VSLEVEAVVPPREGADPDVLTPEQLRARRSLRASQARRAALARRRRRSLRGRAGLSLAIAGLTVAAAGALAQEPISAGGSSAEGEATPPSSADSASSKRSQVIAIQRALGLPADGVYGRRTRAAVRRFQRRNDLAVDGVAGPKTLAALGVGEAKGSDGQSTDGDAETTATDGAAEPVSDGSDAAATTSPTLERIAQCESGGDITAVSPDGRYRGKYQSDRTTCRQMGGSGDDPAQASEAEQDRMAAKLLEARGTAPWPVCGKS